jgi:hypothetical protein
MTEYHAITTLNEIREHSPCEDGWKKLLAHLGKTKADDEPLHLLTVLKSNGFDDALWCLRAKSLDRLSRHFQAWCAEQVLHHFEAERPGDMRVRDQIAMLRNDGATESDRAAASAAAQAASWAASRAAAQAASWAASWDTALAAAQAASWDTALAAAQAAQERQLRAMIGGA